MIILRYYYDGAFSFYGNSGRQEHFWIFPVIKDCGSGELFLLDLRKVYTNCTFSCNGIKSSGVSNGSIFHFKYPHLLNELNYKVINNNNSEIFIGDKAKYYLKEIINHDIQITNDTIIFEGNKYIYKGNAENIKDIKNFNDLKGYLAFNVRRNIGVSYIKNIKSFLGTIEF